MQEAEAMNQTNEKQRKSYQWITTGLIVMVLLSLTQLVPSIRIAGYSVLVGIAFFFTVESIQKTPKEESALRFKTFPDDIRKPGVWIWALLPVVTAILPMLLGDWLFKGAFSAHVLGRVDGMLTFDNIPLLIFQIFILAWGEEIAWRGFFLNRVMEKAPFWLAAIVSSILFAMGHISDAGIGLLLYDLVFVFIDSMIFSVVFRKSGNCLVSTASHILGNAVGLLICLAF